MYLPAISVGYAVPDGNFDAEIHSVFQSALNIRVKGENHLLTLISGENDLPQGIRLAVPKSFSFGDFQVGNFREGELVICSDGVVYFENNTLTIRLSGARRWRCDLPGVGRTDSPTNPSAWSCVWTALNKRQEYLKAEIVMEELFQESAQTGVLRKAGEALRGLITFTRQYDLNDSPLKALIGLGPGLTPSGDDLLIGYLAGLWCKIQDKDERMKFISSLGKTIIRLSSETNDISRTYLYHAAQGQVSSHLADLAEAISRGRDPEHLAKISEAAFEVGHTSGVDTVTGLLVGLAAWTNQNFLHVQK